MEVDDKKIKLSDFNEGQLQLQRLHNIWLKCNYFLTRGDYLNWNWNLDCAWIELSPDAYDFDKQTKEEEDKYFSKIEKLNEDVSNSLKNKDGLYKLLMKKHIFLKLLQERVGKGGRKSEHFEDSLMTG